MMWVTQQHGADCPGVDRAHRRNVLLWCARQDLVLWSSSTLQSNYKALSSDSHQSMRRCCRPLPKWEFRDYLGWQEQGDGKWAYGVFVQNGRLKGEMKKALRQVRRQAVAPLAPCHMQTSDLALCHGARLPQCLPPCRISISNFTPSSCRGARPLQCPAVCCPGILRGAGSALPLCATRSEGFFGNCCAGDRAV